MIFCGSVSNPPKIPLGQDSSCAAPGGILIPDTAGEKPTEGRVMAVGKGKILENGKVRPMDLKVGDRVLFGKYSGTEVKVAGEELIVAREEDIIAVIDEPPAERKS